MIALLFFASIMKVVAGIWIGVEMVEVVLTNDVHLVFAASVVVMSACAFIFRRRSR